MSEKIEVELSQVKDIFLLLEELNDFFHDPDKYRDQTRVVDYVESGMYSKLHTAYYTTVWNWLPPEVQQQIEDRPSPFDE
jgi:hypothetical protein